MSVSRIALPGNWYLVMLQAARMPNTLLECDGRKRYDNRQANGRLRRTALGMLPLAGNFMPFQRLRKDADEWKDDEEPQKHDAEPN